VAKRLLNVLNDWRDPGLTVGEQGLSGGLWSDKARSEEQATDDPPQVQTQQPIDYVCYVGPTPSQTVAPTPDNTGLIVVDPVPVLDCG
jgi:hypothetical protein